MNAILSKDHLGQIFPSLSHMASHWGLKPCTVWARIDAGWQMDDALTTPPIQHGQRRTSVRKDHTGREFSTTAEMCRYWGVKYTTFKDRLKSRWTLKDALTTPRYQHIKESV